MKMLHSAVIQMPSYNSTFTYSIRGQSLAVVDQHAYLGVQVYPEAHKLNIPVTKQENFRYLAEKLKTLF